MLQSYSKPVERASPSSTNAATPNQSLPRIMERLVLAIILLMPVIGLFFPPDIWLHYPGNDISVRDAPIVQPITQNLVRFTWIAIVYFSVKNWRGNFSEVKYTFLILLQLMGFFSSCFWSEDFVVSFKQCVNMFVVYLLMLHIVHNYSVKQFVAFMTQLFAVSAIASILVIVLLPGMSHNLGAEDYGNTWRGAYIQKNVFGEACSLGILTAAYSWYTRANSRILSGFVIGASAILLLGSDSVTSILTTVVGMTIYGVAYVSRSFAGKLSLVFLALGVGLVAIAVLTNVNNLAGLVGRTTGLTGRTALWQALDGMIAMKPLHGYGIGFWLMRNHDDNDIWIGVGWGAPEAHNDVLDVLLQTGMIGLTFYIINNVTAFLLGLRRFGQLQDGSIYCLVIVVAFIYRSYTETESVGTAGRAILILYVVQAYLYKLSFSRQPVVQPSKRPQNLPANSSVIS